MGGHVGVTIHSGFVLNAETVEGHYFQMGNIRLTSGRCMMEIIYNKVLYHYNHVAKTDSPFAVETELRRALSQMIRV